MSKTRLVDYFFDWRLRLCDFFFDEDLSVDEPMDGEVERTASV